MTAEGQFLLPIPNGRYAVGYSTTKLVDEARKDPYDSASGKRVVMVSLFYPMEQPASQEASPVAYMPPKTAATLDAGLARFGIPQIFGTISLQISTAASPDSTKHVQKFPLVLFSPGLTFSRHQYNALAQSIASEGFAVVTMDHTHETIVVEYPDGTHVQGKPPTHWNPQNKERHEELLATRVDDASFVLTQLGNTDVVESLVPGAVGAFDTTKAAIIGHSFGGTTAISTLMKDTRFVGAVNMDGSQYGPLTDTNKPVLLLGRGEPSPRNRTNNPTWQPLWERLKGRKWEVNLEDSEHLTFCDTPLLIKLSGMEKTNVLAKMVGALDGEKAFQIVTSYLKAFLGFALGGKDSALLVGQSRAFPEVVLG
jgi:dienelactone hydrolase